MLKTLCKVAFLLLLPLPLVAQVSPFMGLGNAQFFDNNGAPLLVGVLYSYQGGTTTFQATFTDSTGLVQNPNPLPFTSGARTAIWLTSSATYKFVLCLQNDGPFCAPADVLFSVDQVPGSPSGSGGGGGGSGTFTGTFISGSASPASSGILRLASGDALCWRNAAGTANLCITKDTSDVLAWAGGTVKLPENACSATGIAFDYLCASSTNHRWLMANNGGAETQIVGAGVDINTSDQVTQWHFGATATPLGTAPTSGQYLVWNGTSITGVTPPFVPIAASADQTAQAANISATTLVTPSANGAYFLSCFIVLTQAATTSSVLPGCNVGFTDPDSSTAHSLSLFSTLSNNAVGQTNSGINFLSAKSGVAITYSTTGYASVGATPMQYAIHVRLEGPF